MTHEGIIKVFMVMVAMYPNFKPPNKEQIIAVWEKVLEGYPDNEMLKALSTYIKTDTSGFAPVPGKLIEIATHDPTEPGELEAWGMVVRAVRNGNYHAEEEYRKLPEVVRDAVGDPAVIREWAASDIQYLATSIQQSFLRSYRVSVERARRARAAPELGMVRTERQMIEAQEEPVLEGTAPPEAVRELVRRLADGAGV